MRSASEEIADAKGERKVGDPEHPRGPADYTVTQHPAVKRAERAVRRSAHGTGVASPAAVKQLHDAYRTAGAAHADDSANSTWRNLDRMERMHAITDPESGNRVLAHLAEVHRHTRTRNDPAASKETKAAHAEAADKAYRGVHSVQAATEFRERQDARRMAAQNRINSGDPSGAVDLLPPKASDTHVRRIAEAITPQVDPSLTGKRLQAATAVRAAQVEFERAKMHEDAIRNRVEARRSINPSWDNGGVKAALDAEYGRNASEWVEATKTREAALKRLDDAKEALSSANAEHQVAVGKQHADVMGQMRAEFDKLGELPKSTEGKDIARAAGVPRTITRLTGHEKELAREVNKRADILNEGLDKSAKFNRQADIVVATHGRLTGTLHPEVQDRLDAVYDQARDQRGDGPNSIYRENLNEAIERWNLFQRAKNGVPPRDEAEMAHRESLASGLESTFGLDRSGRDRELAARIRAGNKPGGLPAEEAPLRSGTERIPVRDLKPGMAVYSNRLGFTPGQHTVLDRVEHGPRGARVWARGGWTSPHLEGTDVDRNGPLGLAPNSRVDVNWDRSDHEARRMPNAPRAIESEEAESALPDLDVPKPRASRTREYKEPAENTLEPGAKVSWTHEHEDGTTTTRTGRVWSKAPKPSNAQDAAWVTPDEKLPSDRYSAIVVHQEQRTKKGRPVRFVSHDNDKTHSGSLGAAAALAAERNRATGKSSRPFDPLIEAAIEHALSVAAA